MAASISVPALGAVAAGSLMLYAALKGKTVLGSVQALIKGKSPSTSASANPIPIAADIAAAASSAAGSVTLGNAPAGNTGAASPSAASNQALAKMLAISMGHADWTTGAQWSDWVSLWNQESGWSITAANPTSNARGIAQNINGYGPDYLQGNAQSQISWGIRYIEERYPAGPIEAWAHEVADNWY